MCVQKSGEQTMRRFVTWFSVFVVLVVGCSYVAAAENKSIYLIFDASNSMWGELPDKQRKIAVAKQVLADFDATDFADRDLALRVYGHRRAKDCSDTELVVPFAASSENLDDVRAAVQAVTPRGKTPIARSLKAALDDFGDRQGDILLISDGIETCDIDPCELMENWQRDGIEIRVHVVGFGLDEVARDAMVCVAETSGGRYFDAGTADQFAEAIKQASEVAVASEPSPPEPDPQPAAKGSYLNITAFDPAGKRVRIVAGTAIREGARSVKVSSEGNYWLEPGEYELEVGVQTRSGEIFKPVKATASVTKPGANRVEITVNRPPMVRARYVEKGETVKGASTISARQEGAEVFKFRWKDEVFVMPGTYEFHTKPNADNDLRQTVTVQEGADIELVWELVNTVRIFVEYVLTGGKEDRRSAQLWRDGEHVYTLLAHNYALVQPGIYELRTVRRLTQAVIEKVEIADEENRTYKLPIDVGYIVVSYDPDGEYKRTPDRAVVTSKADPKNSLSGRQASISARLNTPLPASPGEYAVSGWSSAGEFDDVIVTVGKGETIEAVLTPK